MKTRIIRAYKSNNRAGDLKFTFYPEPRMKRIKGLIMGPHFFLSLANSKGIIIHDVLVIIGYMRGDKHKVKVDIPLDGKPIYGRVRSDNFTQPYEASVYFIIEEEEENETK